ncbi:hypothetical protein ABW20_dc0104697 [Dactylellina cionopaga]|nr:hypothetical protein ABW20_dc0104697 [Dactylellina cionopaga]
MSNNPFPGARPQVVNPWVTGYDSNTNIDQDLEPRQPEPAVILPEVYFCHYADGVEDNDDGDISGIQVIRGQDLIRTSFGDRRIVAEGRLEKQQEQQHDIQQDHIGRNSPTATIVVSNSADENVDQLLKTLSSQEARASRFRERLSLDDVSIPSSMFTAIDIGQEDKAKGMVES